MRQAHRACRNLSGISRLIYRAGESPHRPAIGRDDAEAGKRRLDPAIEERTKIVDVFGNQHAGRQQSVMNRPIEGFGRFDGKRSGVAKSTPIIFTPFSSSQTAATGVSEACRV